MKRILRDLNRTIDARGSLVISRDGIPVAACARAEFHVDRVSALAQKVIRQSAQACAAFGAGEFSRFILTADYGRMIFAEMPQGYLVVIASPGAGVEDILLEIESAARRIERFARIPIDRAPEPTGKAH